MQPIQLVDLYGQYLNLKSEIDQAMQEVIASSKFIKTGKVVDFEKQLSHYLETEVISCGNGTDALQIAFTILGLNPGDEVITTPFTFVSTVEVLVLLGLKPVFVDVEPSTFNMNVSEIEDKITPKTKAILPVHLYGQCVDMGRIVDIAQKHKLFIIEDNAQALGADFYFKDGTIKKAGTIGHIGTTSFFPTKTLGAFGDGGAIFSSNTEFVNKMRSIANHGMIAKYEYNDIGLNSRLDSIQAAILNVKLKYLNQHLKARQIAASFYDANLKDVKGLSLPIRSTFCSHVFHQYTIRTKYRDELKEYLDKTGIPTAVYYPKPLHMQKAYQFLGYSKGDLPYCEELSETVLSLPMHTELEDDQLLYIIKNIKQFFNQR